MHACHHPLLLSVLLLSKLSLAAWAHIWAFNVAVLYSAQLTLVQLGALQEHAAASQHAADHGHNGWSVYTGKVQHKDMTCLEDMSLPCCVMC